MIKLFVAHSLDEESLRNEVALMTCAEQFGESYVLVHGCEVVCTDPLVPVLRVEGVV